MYSQPVFVFFCTERITMQHADQKYITALIENDVPVLEELYQKFSGKIKWMVLQNHGTETDAADVFQDALLSVFNKARTGNFTLTCPFEAFLYVVCKNKWMKELSKRKTRQVTITDPEEYNNAGEDCFKLAEELHLQQERKRMLNKKLEELGQGCKELLHLNWSGKSLEEVAAILHVTYGYVRKKKSQCMGKLIMLVKSSSLYNSLK